MTINLSKILLLIIFLSICFACKDTLKRENSLLRLENENLLKLLNQIESIDSSWLESRRKKDAIINVENFENIRLNQESDFYFRFDLYPAFNTDRKVIIVSNLDGRPHLKLINYNFDPKCNPITGGKLLDETCLINFQQSNIKLNDFEIQAFKRKLDILEFWNLSNKTYNADDDYYFCGYKWEMQGKIVISPIYLDSIQVFENTISRNSPEMFHSMYQIGNYLKTLAQIE